MGFIHTNKRQKTKLPEFALVSFGELGFLFSPVEFALVKSISGISGGREKLLKIVGDKYKKPLVFDFIGGKII